MTTDKFKHYIIPIIYGLFLFLYEYSGKLFYFLFNDVSVRLYVLFNQKKDEPFEVLPLASTNILLFLSWASVFLTLLLMMIISGKVLRKGIVFCSILHLIILIFYTIKYALLNF